MSDWATDGWRTVVDLRGWYVPGFDPAQTYEFRRVDGDVVSVFALADQPPEFNVFGLMWRLTPPPKPANG